MARRIDPRMSAPLASILVPTLDGEADLERLLPALQVQELAGGFEILAIDSDSRDTTRQLLREHGVKLQRIARSEFGHGRTRNALGGAAAGRFLVFLSQDALPRDPHFLEALLAPFADAAVAGVQARILPHPDQDGLTRRTALSLAEASAGPLPEGAGIVFNNVASAIRATDLAAHPFPEVPFGEDWAWASAVRAGGRELAFAPEAVAYHAHRYTPEEAFRRYEVDAIFRRQVLGERVRPTLASLIRGIAYELRQDLRFCRAEGGALVDLLRAPALRSAQVLGQFVGSRRWPLRPEPDFSRANDDKRGEPVGPAHPSESTGTP